MLSTLKIQNLAIVDNLEVEFSPGLNVITGETGAGKSIILKSIDLLSGKRASGDLLRSGATQCIIEGLFHQDARPLPEVDDLLSSILSEEEILIKRVIDASGKSKVYINGELATSSLLQNLSPYILDLTGQHEQQSLLNQTRHREMLDDFGVAPELLENISLVFRKYQQSRKRLEQFREAQKKSSARLEELSEIISDLQKANLASGKRQAVETKIKTLSSIEALTMRVNSALELISAEEQGLEQGLESLAQTISEISSIDPKAAPIAEIMDSALAEVREVRLQLEEYGAALELQPEQLEQLRTQLSDIARVERKYSRNENELLELLAQSEQEWQTLSQGELGEAALLAELNSATAELKVLENKLSSARALAAEKLSRAVEAGLKDLSMKHAKFQVNLSPISSSEQGAEEVSFLLAANPGEPARPLNKVASGGELSRILLVLKTVLSEKQGAGTQVFDEIDSGIGGAVAQIVGEKLKDLARKKQVILVTHSPQIAAFGDSHLLLAKTVKAKQTQSNIKLLNSEERVQVLASMLAGKNVSQNFEHSARELLSLSSK